MGNDWSDLKFNSNYKINNDGVVVRKQDNYTMSYRPGGYKKTYLRVQICRKDYYVHRLVLEHFLGECPKGMQCAHLDGNPKNNHILNLKWVTPKQNSQHKVKHGTSGKGEKNARAKLSDVQALEIIKLYSKNIHPKIISEKFGIKNITQIATLRTWKHLKVSTRLINKNKKIAKMWRSTSNDRKNTLSL